MSCKPLYFVMSGFVFDWICSFLIWSLNTSCFNSLYFSLRIASLYWWYCANFYNSCFYFFHCFYRKMSSFLRHSSSSSYLRISLSLSCLCRDSCRFLKFLGTSIISCPFIWHFFCIEFKVKKNHKVARAYPSIKNARANTLNPANEVWYSWQTTPRECPTWNLRTWREWFCSFFYATSSCWI